MTTTPAGDGDTRPTDRERLAETVRVVSRDHAMGLTVDEADLIADALLAACASAPPEVQPCGVAHPGPCGVPRRGWCMQPAGPAPAPPDAAQAQMGEREDEAWDEFNDTTGARCCDCPSCNFYNPDYEQHRGKPCVMHTAIERIIEARRADRLAAPEPDAAVDESLQHQRPPEPFSLGLVSCPSCGHGIDPHVGWRGPCGVGDAAGRRCPCLWTPNDIAGTLLGWRTAAPEPDAATRTVPVEVLRKAAAVDHKGPDDTDAAIMRRTARDLRGGYDAGGSNRRAAVARVLDVVADLIEPAAADPGTRGEGDHR